MNTYEGNLVANNIKIGIVVARFNEFITSKLLSGALDNLKRENVNEKDIEVAWVPGAFEISLIASKMAKSKNMMQLSAWELSLEGIQVIMIMYVARYLRESPKSV
ncbi:6,7-dimethyl-8-ribityllumazine synthase [Streptococcus pneumoniae 2070335]|nr:6,7-dimethyl-8-ribityllumazine synthase [Streptococcus pneumoniae 2070335]